MNDYDTIPLEDAAKIIGCRALTLARAVKRAGLYDPIGLRMWRRKWVVARLETEGQRLAMHRRRLCTRPSVADLYTGVSK